MNSSFSYNGVVTLVTKVGDKTKIQKFHNNGTDKLFEAYARALAGQSIHSLLPSHLNLGIVSGETFNSTLGNRVPVTVTYVSATEIAYDVSYDYGVPYTRVSTILTKNMMKDSINGDLTARLETPDGNVLAEVLIPGLGDTLKNIGRGIQLILLWDLYIVNDKNG
jgi:hypothetical protein